MQSRHWNRAGALVRKQTHGLEEHSRYSYDVCAYRTQLVTRAQSGIRKVVHNFTELKPSMRNRPAFCLRQEAERGPTPHGGRRACSSDRHAESKAQIELLPSDFVCVPDFVYILFYIYV